MLTVRNRFGGGTATATGLVPSLSLLTSSTWMGTVWDFRWIWKICFCSRRPHNKITDSVHECALFLSDKTNQTISKLINIDSNLGPFQERHSSTREYSFHWSNQNTSERAESIVDIFVINRRENVFDNTQTLTRGYVPSWLQRSNKKKQVEDDLYLVVFVGRHFEVGVRRRADGQQRVALETGTQVLVQDVGESAVDVVLGRVAETLLHPLQKKTRKKKKPTIWVTTIINRNQANINYSNKDYKRNGKIKQASKLEEIKRKIRKKLLTTGY